MALNCTNTATFDVSSTGCTISGDVSLETVEGTPCLDVDINYAVEGNGQSHTGVLAAGEALDVSGVVSGVYTVCAGIDGIFDASTCCNSTTTAPESPLITLFSGGNSHNGNMFNVNVKQNIRVQGLLQTADTINADEFYSVYYRVGNYSGEEGNSSKWTLLFTQPVDTTPLNFTTEAFDLPLTAGVLYAFYVTFINGSDVAYTDGDFEGAVSAENGDLTIYQGLGVAYPFGSTFTPRRWNGAIEYVYDYCQSATVTVDCPSGAASALRGMLFF